MAADAAEAAADATDHRLLLRDPNAAASARPEEPFHPSLDLCRCN